MRRTIALIFATGALVAIGVSPASAGEVNGRGDVTGAVGNARSICMYSGLEDGSEGGPAGPGNTQNWGQVPREVRAAIGTSGEEHPGNACNGHTGFLSGGH